MRHENGILQGSVDLRFIKYNPDTVVAPVAQIEFRCNRDTVDGEYLL